MKSFSCLLEIYHAFGNANQFHNSFIVEGRGDQLCFISLYRDLAANA